jgi:DNA-binding GntR family transcriptional regulator
MAVAGQALGSRSDAVYDALKASIVDGELAPGVRLREEEIAERLGVSRTPVREALGRLEVEGLLEAGPNRGLAVARLDQQQIAELHAVREVLDGTAARLAAQHASEGDLRLLADLLERFRAEVESGVDPRALRRLNAQFHRTIHRAARNRYLLGALGSLNDTLALAGATLYTVPGRARTALADHARILDALVRRDPTAAEEAARQHVRSAGDLWLALMVDAPER